MLWSKELHFVARREDADPRLMMVVAVGSPAV